MQTPKEKALRKAESYISENNLQQTLAEMMNSLLHAQTQQNPIVWMIKYLANLLPTEELHKAGITVTDDVLPARVPIKTYETLGKVNLPRSLWSEYKRKRTSKGGSI